MFELVALELAGVWGGRDDSRSVGLEVFVEALLLVV